MVKNTSRATKSSKILQFTVALSICAYTLYSKNSGPKPSDTISNGTRGFRFSNDIGFRVHDKKVFGDGGSSLFLMHISGLMGEEFTRSVHQRANENDIIIVLVSYEGSSFADKQASILMARMGSAPSNAPPMPGYNVVTVVAGQELYISNTNNQLPNDILCYRDEKPDSNAMPLCTVRDSIEQESFPVKDDGRFPLVLTYTVPKSFLQKIPEIDTYLRSYLRLKDID